MKSLETLWMRVLAEAGTRCCVCTLRDRKTAAERIEHEGLAFLTITLPSFGKDFQKSLELGKVDRNLFQGFSWQKGLPRFLGGFLDLVFDRGTGVLLTDPSIDAIRSIRQITLLVEKARLPISQWRVDDAIRSYVECEKEVQRCDSERTLADYQKFTRMSHLLFSGVFPHWDRQISRGEITPKHGPGATAEKSSSNRKYSALLWSDRMESLFSAGEFLFPNMRFFLTEDSTPRSDVNFLEPGAEIPVRVITVPKTMKTPRIIAIEPVYVQYMQQALLESFMVLWRRDDILSSLLGFDDQLPNQQMAQRASSDGSLATLDLSEASDRVSNQLVRAMVRNYPYIAGALDVTRSRKADVPGYGVIRLAKFASMGSAVCFPVEAMVFLTVVFLGIEQCLGHMLTRDDIKSFVGQVRIFGDDIIVPSDMAHTVVETLHSFGFAVNTGKSYWNGKFRESCGGDFYDGSDVGIVRVRSEIPTRRQHVEEVIATVSLRNQLYEAGYRETCDWLDDRLASILRGYYPVVQPTSSALGRVHDSQFYQIDRMDPRLHRPLVKAFRVRAQSPLDILENEFALQKFFLKRGFEPLDVRSLERAGRPKRVDIKLGWTTPF
jgi:hypothetical protein